VVVIDPTSTARIETWLAKTPLVFPDAEQPIATSPAAESR
jgi:hypothetical protein